MATKKQKKGKEVRLLVPTQPTTTFWVRMKMVGVGRPYATREDAIKNSKKGEVVTAVIIPPMTVVHSEKVK